MAEMAEVLVPGKGEAREKHCVRCGQDGGRAAAPHKHTTWPLAWPSTKRQSQQRISLALPRREALTLRGGDAGGGDAGGGEDGGTCGYRTGERFLFEAASAHMARERACASSGVLTSTDRLHPKNILTHHQG